MTFFRKAGRTEIGRSGMFEPQKFGTFRGFLSTVFLLFLTMPPQFVHAQDVCSLLDKVVAAGKDNPPFTSVRHLTAPNATKCKIGGSWWKCTWVDRNIQQAYEEYRDAAEEKRDASKEFMDAFSEHGDALNESTDFILKDDKDYWMSDEAWKAEAERLDAKEERLRAEQDRLHEKWQRLRAEEDRLFRKFSQLNDGRLSQVQTLVSSIQQCFYKNAIRGSWSSFEETVEDPVEEKDHPLLRETSKACQDSGLGLCLEVYYPVGDGAYHRGEMVLQVYYP